MPLLLLHLPFTPYIPLPLRLVQELLPPLSLLLLLLTQALRLLLPLLAAQPHRLALDRTPFLPLLLQTRQILQGRALFLPTLPLLLLTSKKD